MTQMTILLLDDDQLILKSLKRALEREGYHVITASSGAAAVEAARRDLLDLIICDVRMPEVDGLDTLGALRELQEGVRSIVITGYASEDTPIRAIKAGVDDYLLKPVPVETLLKSVRHSLELRRLERRNRDTVDLLKRRYLQIITTLVGAFQDQDAYFFAHSRRVAALSVDLGSELGLAPAALDRLELAALLHDVGLAYIDRSLLSKTEALSEAELQQLRSHPLLAQGLLDQVPGLSEIAPILSALREHYDGSGSPRGLRGDAIPLEARILAVAEAYDSLTHERPHRPAQTPEAALETLRAARGTRYDPMVVSVCADLAQETRELTDTGQLLARSPDRQAVREKYRSLERLGNLFREAGQFETARCAYQGAQQLLSEAGESDLRASLLVQAGLLGLAESDPNRAAQMAGQARRELEPLENGPRLDPVWLDLARLYLGLNRPAQAGDVLNQVSDASAAARDRLRLRTCLAAGQEQPFRDLFPSWAASLITHGQSPGQARDSLELLCQGLKLGLGTTAIQESLSDLVSNWPALRELAQDRLSGLDTSFLPEPVSAVPSPTPAAARATAPNLEVHCFGRLRVSIAGEAVDPKAWSTRKAQELFAFLVLSGRAVSSTRLAEVLWPEGSDKVKKNLHTTVSRVRRALRTRAGDGQDLSVIQSDRDFYFLDPEVPIWADLWEFERVSEALGRHTQAQLSDAQAADCRRAIALYEGDFLEGIWEEWTFEARNSLKEKWFRLLDRLAAHHQESGQPDRALECFEQMLERDNCREEAHLGTMRSLLSLGRRDAAVRRYHDYCKTLERELGLSPSPQAATLYYQIVDAQ